MILQFVCHVNIFFYQKLSALIVQSGKAWIFIENTLF